MVIHVVLSIYDMSVSVVDDLTECYHQEVIQISADSWRHWHVSSCFGPPQSTSIHACDRRPRSTAIPGLTCTPMWGRKSEDYLVDWLTHTIRSRTVIFFMKTPVWTLGLDAHSWHKKIDRMLIQCLGDGGGILCSKV